MKIKKIIARPESMNLWYGVHGICEKTTWEDIHLYTEDGEKIDKICLESKDYYRYALEDEAEDTSPETLELWESYVKSTKCEYQYCYCSSDLEPLPYPAPENEKGVKPHFLTIIHPDDGIDLNTIEDAIKNFAKVHLNISDCEVEIQNQTSFDEALESYAEGGTYFSEAGRVVFADELVEKLSQTLNQSKEKVLRSLKRSVGLKD